jgi:hypothetical protein
MNKEKEKANQPEGAVKAPDKAKSKRKEHASGE